jgi:hypothetical protein
MARTAKDHSPNERLVCARAFSAEVSFGGPAEEIPNRVTPERYNHQAETGSIPDPLITVI